jgi:hypothetical protein
MSESNEQKELLETGPVVSGSGEDNRLPYEPPKLIKKRSVARATLSTPMGSSMTGTTMTP